MSPESQRCRCWALLGAGRRRLVRRAGPASTASLAPMAALWVVAASRAKVALCRRTRRLLGGAALAGVRWTGSLIEPPSNQGSEPSDKRIKNFGDHEYGDDDMEYGNDDLELGNDD